MKKFKKAQPEELKALLQEFILNQPAPHMIDPKPRARRNKKLVLNQIDMKLILKLVQKSGDQYLLSKLGGKLSLPRIKKELIQSVKAGRVEEELWQAYVQSVESCSRD